MDKKFKGFNIKDMNREIDNKKILYLNEESIINEH
jgi:hypothetical protein